MQTENPSPLVTAKLMENGGFEATALLTTEHLSEREIQAIYDDIVAEIPKLYQHDFTWHCVNPSSCKFTLRFRRREGPQIFTKLMFLLRILQRIDEKAAIDAESFVML